MGEFRGEELETLYRETCDNIINEAYGVINDVEKLEDMTPDSEMLGGLLEAEELIKKARSLI